MARIGQKIGQRIASQRKLAGVTQARLAEQIGVEPETISRLETGASMPSLAKIAATADALDIELRELFRFRTTDAAVEAAIDRLVWLVSRRTVQEIELVIELAARVFAHKRQEAERLAGAKEMKGDRK